jgi:hypothetical protein
VGPAADLILVTGLITAGNEVLFAPLAQGSKPDFNWRLIPATAIAAFMIEGLSKLNPQIALGVSVSALITALFATLGKAGSPVTNAAKALGYQT